MKKTILLVICILLLNEIDAQKANHRIEAREVSDTSTNIQNLTNLDIVAYPNPVTDKLTIKSQDIIDNINVFNGSGLLLIKLENIGSFETLINLERYKSKIYFVEVNNRIFKIIKK